MTRMEIDELSAEVGLNAPDCDAEASEIEEKILIERVKRWKAYTDMQSEKQK